MKSALQNLRTFLSNLAPQDNESLETYLAQSSSLADLERRERQWHLASADRALFAIGVRSH
jgi:hypothetical protein